ncbi:hypothetical protein R6Q59_028956 [Mikania micrantha]
MKKNGDSDGVGDGDGGARCSGDFWVTVCVLCMREVMRRGDRRGWTWSAWVEHHRKTEPKKHEKTGYIVYYSIRDMSFDTPIQWSLDPKIFTIGVIAVVKAFSSRLWIWDFYNTESTEIGYNHNCGSSGTRVYIYEWMLKAVATTNSNRNLEFPILLRTFPDNLTEIDHHKDGCAYHCMQTEPGLDKFVGDAYGIEKSLEPLIRRAEKWVPNEKHQDTPIFVLATAGLRRLNKDIARGVLDDIENVVKLHEFKVRKDWIRVLSGEEEAYYGWIALNHHMGMFGNTSRLPTLGLLDLGGSSLQVATESKQLKGNEYGIFRSKIGSFEHQIMAASLPTFGLNEAFDRTVVMLSHSQAFIERDFGTFEIAHPCLSYEFTQNYTCHGCFEGNFTRKIRKSNNFLINLVGEPNWEKCKLLARAAAVNSSSSDWSKLSDDSYCTGLSSINGVYYVFIYGFNKLI